jgi:PAS domain S-box-containing protein
MAGSASLRDEIALLYELSLSVGASLSREDNARSFLETLVARKGLDYGVLWMEPAEGPAAGFHPVAAVPAGAACPEGSRGHVPPDHTLAQRIRRTQRISVAAEEVGRAHRVPGRTVDAGAYAILPLGGEGFVEIADSRRPAAFPTRELRQLAPVLTKLRHALRGSRAHERLQAEIQQRKASEAELRRSQTKLSALLHNLQDAILVEDDHRRVLLANEAFCDLFAIDAPPDALVGADCREAAAAARDLFVDPAALTDRVADILEAGDKVSAETLHLTDGRIVERDYVPVPIGDDRTGHLWKYRDVTAQRRADARLAEREREFRRLVESASDIIFRCNLEGRFTYVNPVAEEATGYRRDALLGRHYTALVRPDHRTDLRAFYRQQVADEIADTHREFPVVTADGDEIWLGQRVQLIHRDGDVVGIQAVARDITERKQAEAELRQNEERLRTMFEKHRAPMLLIDPGTGAIVDANASAVDFYGYDAGELTAMRIRDLNELPPDEVDRRRRAANRGDQNRFVFPHRLQSGEVRTVEVYSTPIQVQGTTRLFSIIHDITARQEAQRKLQESRRKFKTLFEASHDAIFLYDLDGQIIDANQRAADLFHMDRETLLQRKVKDIEPPEVRNKVTREFNRVRSGETVRFDTPFRREDGTQFQAEVSASPISVGVRVLVQAIVRDVTEQREAEAEIRRLKNFYEQVLNAMPVHLAIFDPQGRYEYVTPSAVSDPERRETIIGMTDVAYARARGNDVEQARRRLRTIRRVAETRATEQFEETIAVPDGDNRHFVRFVSPLVQDDEVVQVLGFGMEITRRKQAETELRAAKQQAEASLEAQERFLATMSHEIRTPLNAVLGMTHLLARSELSDQQRSYLESIRFSADTLLSLLNTVLDYAKMEAEDLTLDETVFSPEGLSRQVAAMLRSKAIEKGVDLSIEIGDAVPDHVRGDAARISQVLTNLVSNALKFTDEGSVTLRVERWDRPPARPHALILEDASLPSGGDDAIVPTGEGPVWLQMQVADTGIGIPEDQQEHVFEDFGRAEAPDGRRRSGTGLGLSIVCRILEHMGGSIDLDSEVGRGTVVTVKAPFGTASDDAAPKDVWLDDARPGRSRPGRSRPGTAGTDGADPGPARPDDAGAARGTGRRSAGGGDAHLDGHEGTLTGRRILVVEDNALNQVVVRDLLTGWGAAVDVAETGTEALRHLGVRDDAPAPSYDIVLMDVQMPGMDGLEATRRLRRHGTAIPVVALTASMLQDNRQKAFDAGMDAFVTKPFDPEDLYQTVTEHLPERMSSPAPDAPEASPPSGSPPSSPPPSGEDDGAVLDLSFLHENVDDPDVVRHIAQTFRDQAETFLSDLQRLRREGEHDALRDLFHWLKSSAHMIGAKRLAGRLDDLHAADPPYAADVLDAVAASVRHVHRTLPGAIERYVDSSGSSPAS